MSSPDLPRPPETPAPSLSLRCTRHRAFELQGGAADRDAAARALAYRRVDSLTQAARCGREAEAHAVSTSMTARLRPTASTSSSSGRGR